MRAASAECAAIEPLDYVVCGNSVVRQRRLIGILLDTYHPSNIVAGDRRIADPSSIMGSANRKQLGIEHADQSRARQNGTT